MAAKPTVLLLIFLSLVLGCVSYLLTGQYMIVIALMIGLFPVIMSLSTRKH